MTLSPRCPNVDGELFEQPVKLRIFVVSWSKFWIDRCFASKSSLAGRDGDQSIEKALIGLVLLGLSCL